MEIDGRISRLSSIIRIYSLEYDHIFYRRCDQSSNYLLECAEAFEGILFPWYDIAEVLIGDAGYFARAGFAESEWFYTIGTLDYIDHSIGVSCDNSTADRIGKRYRSHGISSGAR